MPDRKKVMSWLEGLAQQDWRMFHSDSEVQEIARNALALLKEQEAVEPIIMDHVVFGTSRKCSKCNQYLFPAGRFCPHCGRQVKWDA